MDIWVDGDGKGEKKRKETKIVYKKKEEKKEGNRKKEARKSRVVSFLSQHHGTMKTFNGYVYLTDQANHFIRLGTK